METKTIAQIGVPLAATLAQLYVPAGSQGVSALAAVMAAVAEYQKARALPADYVPSHDELTTFILDREEKQIPLS